MAKTVVFDFDGVIHSYTSGWKGETNIPDPPVPGIQEALKEIHDAGYEVVVVSTRCKTVLGRMAIENWLDMYGMTQEVDKVCKEKPPAIAYIDDRAICFDGHPETLLKKIQNFQPWYKMPTITPPNEPLMPCDVCKFSPPSSSDGKPCCMCPAERCPPEGKEDTLGDGYDLNRLKELVQADREGKSVVPEMNKKKLEIAFNIVVKYGFCGNCRCIFEGKHCMGISFFVDMKIEENDEEDGR